MLQVHAHISILFFGPTPDIHTQASHVNLCSFPHTHNNNSQGYECSDILLDVSMYNSESEKRTRGNNHGHYAPMTAYSVLLIGELNNIVNQITESTVGKCGNSWHGHMSAGECATFPLSK